VLTHLLLTLALAAPTTPAPDRAARDAGPAVTAALGAGAPAGGPRAAAATAPLLGLRYLLSPLGEGAGLDPDPRFRLDAFDCVTFVETAMALGSAASLDEARRALDDIRYASRIDVADRLHEVVSQWIPSNLAKGWVTPASRAVAGEATIVQPLRYDQARWRRLAASGQRLTGVPLEASPVGLFEVEVAPPKALLAHADRIPDGTVAFVVRAERADHLTPVSHAGLVVVLDGRRLVRHASSSAGVMRVIEEPLASFLAGQQRLKGRPVVGLALFAIADGRPRLATLPPADSGPRPGAARTP
jgi:hypothetical protein